MWSAFWIPLLPPKHTNKKERHKVKEFQYTVTDELGIHVRPARLLSKLAKTFPDTVVTITKDGTTVKASQLMKLMGLGIKKGNVVTVAADAAHKVGIWIGICGELAGDISLLPTFLAIGIDELSVSPSMVLPLRTEIRQSIAKTCTLRNWRTDLCRPIPSSFWTLTGRCWIPGIRSCPRRNNC